MIFILNSDEKVVGILTNNGNPNSCPYFDDVLKESIEVGAATYEFYVPSNHDVADTIQEGGYVVRADLDGNLRMFSIMQVEETHGSENKKYVYAEDAGLELLNDIVRPATYENKNQDEILDIVLLGSRWKRGETEYLGFDTFTFENYDNVLATLQSIAKQLNGELSFRVEIKNGEVSGRYVDLVKQRGTDTKKRFTYSKDIVSIKRKVDMSNVVTALVGVGSNDTNFKSIEYTKSANGFDKPLNQDWVGDPDALQRWGKKGKHIFGKFEYDTTDPKTLLDKTWEQLQTLKEPSITYEMDVALLERLAGIEHEKVRIGDTVYIIDETFSPALYLEARVLELETCFSDPSNDKCTLGNYKIAKSNITAQMRALQSKLLKKEATWDQVGEALQVANNAQEIANTAQQTASSAQETASAAQTAADNAQQTANTAQTTAENAQQTATNAENTANNALETANEAKDTANTALESANGKNTNYYGQNEPSNPKNGDIWFVEDAEGNVTAIKHYDGSQWVLDVDNSFIQQALSDAENALAQANSAISAANDANSNAQNAINQAQTAFNTAQDAVTKADEATNQLSTLSQTVEGLQSTVANKADQSTVTQLANVVDTKISQADADAKYATQSQLTQTANSLTSTITSIQQDLDNYQSQITQLSNDINLRVQKDDIINQINLSTEGILIDGEKVHITGQTTIDNAVIKDAMIQSVSADKLTAGTIDADVVTIRNLTAGSIKSLNGLNINNQFIVDSNGNVTFKGNLSGATGTFSGNISTSADANVGNNVNLGGLTDYSQKKITFNDKASISSDGTLLSLRGPNTITLTNNNGASIEMDGNTVNIGGILSADGYIYVNPEKLLTSSVETGNCGVAGINSIGTSGVFAGVWVPFRVRKTYTPASVTLTTGSHNLSSLAGVQTTNATINGFWLYLTGQTTEQIYRYWRGTYSA